MYVDPREKLGSHWTDFHEIWYLSLFRKSVAKNQVSLKSDKNNWYFTWRPMYTYDNISLKSSQNEKYLRQRCRENQNTHFMFNYLSFRKSCRLWHNVENIAQPNLTTKCCVEKLRFAYRILEARIQKRTLKYEGHNQKNIRLVQRSVHMYKSENWYV